LHGLKVLDPLELDQGPDRILITKPHNEPFDKGAHVASKMLSNYGSPLLIGPLRKAQAQIRECH
jgi:hypothetical protein